ncbi:MAG: hypothetical protein AAFX81_16600 [Pseudomonadota bacterium]
MTVGLPLVLGLAIAWAIDRSAIDWHDAQAFVVVDDGADAVGLDVDARLVATEQVGAAVEAELPDEVASRYATAREHASRPALLLANAHAWLAATLGTAPPAAVGPAPLLPPLSARVAEDGRTLSIDARGPTPGDARLVARRTAELVLVRRLERRRAALTERVETFDDRLRRLRGMATTLRGELDVAANAGGPALTAALDHLDARLTAGRAALAVSEADAARLIAAARPPMDLAVVTEQPRSSDVRRLEASRDAAVERLAAANSTYGPRHPVLQRARADLTAAEEALTSATQTVVAAVEQEIDDQRQALAALATERDALRSALAEATAASERASATERRLAETSRGIEALVNARAEAERQRLALVADGRVAAVTDAVRVDRMAERALLYGGAGVAGLTVGLVAARSRSRRLPRRFRNVGQLEDSSGCPVLGALPPLPRRLASFDRSAARDPVQRLWVRLEASALPGRILAVTVAEPGMGATTLAAALALSARRSGFHVLLVDAGAPVPSVARALRLPEKPGLGELAANPQAWPELLQPVADGGPWLLPAGAAASPGDAVRVLGQVLAEAPRRFDRIIVAVPPPGTADGLAAARACQSTLIGVVAGRTHRLAVERAVTDLEEVGVALQGLALLDARARPR